MILYCPPTDDAEVVQADIDIVQAETKVVNTMAATSNAGESLHGGCGTSTTGTVHSSIY